MNQILRHVGCGIALVMLLVLQGCGAGDFASEYAIAKLDLPDGGAIYVKREVRGINGDYDVVAISQDSNPCVSVNDTTDYCICYWRDYVYYKLDGDTLHLYYSTANHVPTKEGFPIKVINHEVQPKDAEEFKRRYAEMGIKRLDLEINSTKKCS